MNRALSNKTLEPDDFDLKSSGSSVRNCLCTAGYILLAGCAGSEQPANLFDKISGDYKVARAEAVSQSPNCPPIQPGILEIGDHRLVFAYAPQAIFMAPIASDGSVHDRTGGISLDGRVAAGWATFTITSPVCQVRYELAWKI
ncbi:MAG: hypothetical protein JOY71_19975 [Acetobacteraceae bacterium]|nr:hypothetical protein [Acetobacteraceae bacterium]